MEDFQKVYQKHMREIFQFLLKMCRNVDVAEELTQETFAIAFRKWEEFQGGNLFVWLCQIAKLEFYSWYRKNKKFDEEPVTEAIENRMVSNDKKPLEQVIDDEIRDEILQVMRELPEPYQTVFVLHIVEEMTFKSIAKRFEKSESWGKMTYKRAKQMIRERLEGKGYVRM